MWSRNIAIAALCCLDCGGPAPAVSPASAEPPLAPTEQAPAAPVERPAPAEVAPAAAPEPVETSQPAPSRPPPPPEPTCAEYDKVRCQVTEGCEWHSVKKCLEQEKPKTLDK